MGTYSVPNEGGTWSAPHEQRIDRETGEYLSEDYAFCRRWRDLGGELWVDLQSKLTHVGPMRFAGDVSTMFDPGKA
jgi:hypothetical protein